MNILALEKYIRVLIETFEESGHSTNKVATKQGESRSNLEIWQVFEETLNVSDELS